MGKTPKKSCIFSSERLPNVTTITITRLVSFTTLVLKSFIECDASMLIDDHDSEMIKVFTHMLCVIGAGCVVRHLEKASAWKRLW